MDTDKNADPRDGLGLPELPRPTCTYADHSYPAYTASQMRAYAQQCIAHARPEAVDEAMSRRLDDYLGGEFDIRIGKQAAHAALIAALTPERAP